MSCDSVTLHQDLVLTLQIQDTLVFHSLHVGLSPAFIYCKRQMFGLRNCLCYGLFLSANQPQCRDGFQPFISSILFMWNSVALKFFMQFFCLRLPKQYILTSPCVYRFVPSIHKRFSKEYCSKIPVLVFWKFNLQEYL